MLDETGSWCRLCEVKRISAVALGSIMSFGIVSAREPANSIADLVKLETKVSQVAAKTMSATVALVSEKTGSSGSGVLVTADGLILTAAHVVQGMSEVDVYFPDGKKWLGKVLGANYSKDIGMVKMIEAGPWPHVELGESKPLEAGDWVVALGHSAGFDPARTPPIRFGRVMSDGPGNFFTTDCTLIGGDSGGPLFDLDGKLVARAGLATTHSTYEDMESMRNMAVSEVDAWMDVTHADMKAIMDLAKVSECLENEMSLDLARELPNGKSHCNESAGQ